MIFAGLMSGTSLDGMDGALIRVREGSPGDYPVAEFGDFTNRSIPYSSHERKLLLAAVQDALQWRFEGADPDSFRKAADLLAEKGAQVIEGLCADNDMVTTDMAAIGFHGQTVLHQPPVNGQYGQTRQIGNAQVLADQSGVKVVHDLRTADMQFGGHGAPLAPAWHFELLRQGKLPAAFINIGGVANVTFVSDATREHMRAFDCGPGNGPLDDWVQHCNLGQMDLDGSVSAAGQAHADIVAVALGKIPVTDGPTSFDRWDFGRKIVAGLSAQDGAATLAAISVHAIARAVKTLDPAPRAAWIGGGGRLNPTIMQGLQAELSMPVRACEGGGMDGDAIEAQAFAWLAALKCMNLPGSWPGTTGVKSPVVGGAICDPVSSRP